MSHGKIVPIALGIITDPPTLVLTYDEVVAPSSKARRRQRRMPIRYTPPPFTDRSKVDYAYFLLKQKHGAYLPEVTQVLVPKLLRLVQELMKGMEIKEALAKVDSEYSVDPDKDLNKVSSAELAQNKLIMDEDFLRKRITPSDKDYVYDKVEDFETGSMKQRSEWDDDDNNDNEGDKAKISEDSVKVVTEDVNIIIPPVETTKSDPEPSLHGESLVETIPPADHPSSPEKVEPGEDQVSFEEQLLLSICDGEIEDDKLLSIYDFDISLPFGDGENITFSMTPEITRDENETQEESQRNRVYMTSESDNNDEDDKHASKVLLKMAPHTVIDIGTSSFLSDVSTLLQEEIDEDDIDIPTTIPYPPPHTDLPLLKREENNQNKTLEKVKIIQDFKDIDTPEKLRIVEEFNKKETPEKVRIVEEFLKLPSEKQDKLIPGKITKEKVVQETKLTDDNAIAKQVPDSDQLEKIEKPKLLEDDDDDFWGL